MLAAPRAWSASIRGLAEDPPKSFGTPRLSMLTFHVSMAPGILARVSGRFGKASRAVSLVTLASINAAAHEVHHDERLPGTRDRTHLLAYPREEKRELVILRPTLPRFARPRVRLDS